MSTDNDFDELLKPQDRVICDFSYLWRKPVGAPPKFETAEELWAECLEYFKWCQDNPLQAEEIVRSKHGAERISVSKLRAYSITGLCAYLGMTTVTWYEWAKTKPEFSNIILRAEETIRSQKFEGASAELLNPGFIARDLGMVDRKDVTTKDRAIVEELDLSQLDEDELEQMSNLSRKLKGKS